MGGRIATNRRWLIASELAFGDRPWFAAPTIDRRCAVVGKAACKTSGFLCSFCAGAVMRSQRVVRFDRGSEPPSAAYRPRSPFMSIIKRFGQLLIWLAGLALIFAAANKNDPYLIALRGPGNVALAIGSVVAVIVLVRWDCWRQG